MLTKNFAFSKFLVSGNNYTFIISDNREYYLFLIALIERVIKIDPVCSIQYIMILIREKLTLSSF